MCCHYYTDVIQLVPFVFGARANGITNHFADICVYTEQQRSDRITLVTACAFAQLSFFLSLRRGIITLIVQWHSLKEERARSVRLK